MTRLLLAACAVLSVALAFIARDARRWRQWDAVDADPLETTEDAYVPMTAWLPENDAYRWGTTIHAQGRTAP